MVINLLKGSVDTLIRLTTYWRGLNPYIEYEFRACAGLF